MPHIVGIEKKKNRYFAHLDHRGKRYTPGRGFNTAKEASRWRITKRNELQHGIGLGSDITFEEFATQYIMQFAERGKSLSSLRTVETLVRVSMIPTLGARKVRDLTVDHISRYRSDLLVKYSPKTAVEIIAWLRRILDRAVMLDVIVKNPTRFVESIHLTRKDPTVLTPEQLRILLSTSLPMERTVFALGGLAGLRRSEVFGLVWDDINFTTNTLTINRQYYAGVIKEPKTKTSRCTLPMLTELAVILKEWKLQSGSEKWLFPGQNEKPMRTDWIHRNLGSCLKRCGLPTIRFHDLRHTFITILLNMGIPLIDVKYLARHSTVTLTERYAHRTPGHLEDVVRGVKVFGETLRRIERRTGSGESA